MKAEPEREAEKATHANLLASSLSPDALFPSQILSPDPLFPTQILSPYPLHCGQTATNRLERRWSGGNLGTMSLSHV